MPVPGDRRILRGMEYHVAFDAAPDLGRIEQVLLDGDPAAVADLDPNAAPVLRVSTLLPKDDLQALLHRAGYDVPSDRIRQLPSICCGGCSG